MKRLQLKPAEDTEYIDPARLVNVGGSEEITIGDGWCITSRRKGDFAWKAIFLPYQYDYVLGTDSDGNTILVPLKKVSELSNTD